MAVPAMARSGLQHASMAIYNAWLRPVPVYVMIGNIIEADKRGLRAEWAHSAIDPARWCATSSSGTTSRPR